MPSLQRYPNRLILSASRARQTRLGRPVLWVLLFSTALAALALFGAWSAESSHAAANPSAAQRTDAVHAN